MKALETVRSAILVAAVLGCTGAAQASTIIDLTAGGEGGSNGALYVWTNFSATGSGVIDAFLRIQNRGTEHGYNHSLGHNVPWDTKPGIHTHDIQVEDLVKKTITGIEYYEFLLDINESNGHDNELLSLDNVQIYTREGPITSPDESFTHLGTLRFDNDAPNDTTVLLNYDLNHGSGSGDMFLYVPVSLFAGAADSDYVYFYSLFGNINESDAGFEEWAMLQNIEGPGGGGEGGGNQSPVVPEPGTMLLMTTGLALAARRLRARS
ncbi:MAG TPA: PEP-CTERM sorting domain-containing protein [Vicinamibacterales bacterium]|nr:PEP-CTERM sorting domain-containing protein [Vicinamibacterales bacterium]